MRNEKKINIMILMFRFRVQFAIGISTDKVLANRANVIRTVAKAPAAGWASDEAKTPSSVHQV